MTRRLVVLGTGTDVGKTFVSAALLRAFKARGRRVLGLKPVESGHDAARTDGDAATLRSASGLGAPPCFGFAEPISPHLAARRAGQTIQLDVIARWTLEQERQALEQGPLDLTLIESAGGLFSPISESATNLDLARTLAPHGAWLLVAADALGVLHDVGASLRALGPAGRGPDFLALSEARARDASTGSNASELETVVFPALGLSQRSAPRLWTFGTGAQQCDVFVSEIEAWFESHDRR